jgi:hypothetical protein
MSRSEATHHQTVKQQVVCRHVSQIVAHLRRIFGIPPGDELALILAPETAPGCNEQALRVWLRSQLADIATHPIEERLLVELEKRLLNTLQEAYPEIGMEVDVPSPLALRANLPMPYWQDMHLATFGRNPHPRRKPVASARQRPQMNDIKE